MVGHLTHILPSYWSIHHHLTRVLTRYWLRETALVVGRCVCVWGNDEFLTIYCLCVWCVVQDLNVAFSSHCCDLNLATFYILQSVYNSFYIPCPSLLAMLPHYR